MLFSSMTFILYFLPVLCVLYFIVPKKMTELKNMLLLLFSLIFYAWGGVRFLGLMLISVLINYAGALAVSKTKGGIRKTVFVLTVVTNILLLGVFKYYGFFAETAGLFGINVKTLDIALPIGISFYTFQGMSYVIDVYRGDAEADRDPLRTALYVSLFPQLVAGPIVRYTDVAAELRERKHGIEAFADGMVRFIFGLGKKMLIANACGEIADEIFGRSPALLGAGVAWMGIIAYTFQIYYDFSAYSDMAIGLGKIFGFNFPENFNYPYISKSVTEFWRRWHISLSSWFRDYVYIPLGGSRCGKVRHIMNLLIVWGLTGFWHGADLSFLLWGIYYGVILIAEKYFFGKYLEKMPSFVRHTVTMTAVIFGWVLFRADTVGGAVSYVCSMFGGGEISVGAASAEYYLREYYPELIMALIGIFPVKKAAEKVLLKLKNGKTAIVLREVLPKAAAFLVLILSYAKLATGSFNPFIYFRF